MKYCLKEMRIKHYIKNLIIFIPLFFSGGLSHINGFTTMIIILTIISFSFMSSAVYIVNDILDVESDRNHPTKKNRPIASGQLSVKDAIVCAVVLFAVSVLLSVFVSIKIDTYLVCLIIILYFVNNMLYSVFHLKNIPLLDVCLLTIGFILRLFVGAVCAGVKNSAWLYLVIIFGSFYLGFGKRKSELVKIKNMNTRKSLMLYDETFLNNAVLSSMILSIAFFALWCREKQDVSGNLLYLFLVPLMTLICLKYLSDIDNKDYDGDPVSTILKDKTLIVMILLTVVVMFVALYLV